VRVGHGTLNERLKNWQILSQRSSTHISMHGDAFRPCSAVAVTQLTFDVQ
jgi:hypothetical protein